MRIDFLFAPELPWLMRLGIASVVTLAVLLVLYFTYRRLFKALPKKFAWIISTSKLLAAIVLLILIFRPVLHFSDSRSFDKNILLLIDTSKSMSIKDSVGNLPRLQAVVSKIDETELISRIRENFDTQTFTFNSADNLKEIEEISELQAEEATGEFSEIVNSAKKAFETSGSGKVDAVVVFTDGVENSASISSKQNIGTKVFTVGVGSSPEENPFFQDIAVDAEAPGQVIAGNKTEIKVTVKLSGDTLAEKYKSLPVTMKSDTETIEGIVEFENGSRIASLSLFATPAEVGKKSYVVSVPVDDAESITANNSKEIELSVSNPKIRILYVEGFPRYEFKGIVSVLGSDPNVQLTALINYGGGSYTAQGKVLKDVDLSKGLPLKFGDYVNFDIVILGDLRPTDLSENQLVLLKNWVVDGIHIKDSLKHGNILFLGGNDSLSGSWRDTSLTELMPVELPDGSSQLNDDKFMLEITSEGMLNQICQGIPQYFAESDNLRSFIKLNGFCRLKPAAESLITANDQRGNSYNVVAVQTVGGRIAVNGLTDTWKSWSFSPGGKGGRTLFTVFWGQLIRWLAGITNEEVDETLTLILPEEKLEPGKNFEIRLIVKDKQNLFVEGAQINASILTPRNEKDELNFKPTGQPGQYVAKFQPLSVGKYQIQCEVSSEGKKLGNVSKVFIVGQGLSEFYRIGVDRSYLKEFAAQNSGKYFNLMTINDLPEALRNAFRDEKRIRDQEYSPNAVLFLLFVALLSVEWFMRRKMHII